MSAGDRRIDRHSLLADIRREAGACEPFGEPPPSLSDRERDSGEVEESAVDFVAGLVANAGKCAEADPEGFSVSLYEAGRALEMRLGRPVEAWCCYCRSHRTGRDNGAALERLAHLSREARDSYALRRVLRVAIDEAEDGGAFRAASLEKAAHEITAGEKGDAMETLRAALSRDPDDSAARLLLLGLSGGEVTDDELCATIDAFVPRTGDAALSAAMTATCAALEESSGRVDEAKERLSAAVGGENVTLESLFSLARLGLRTGDAQTFADALSRLTEKSEGDLAAAFERLARAFESSANPREGRMKGVESASLSGPDGLWDLALVDAVRAGDFPLEAAAASAGKGSVASAPFDAGLEECERLAAAREGALAGAVEKERSSSRGRALARLGAPDDRESADALAAAYREDPVPALHVALATERLELASFALSVMANDASFGEAVHEIAAARAAHLRSALGMADAALAALAAGSENQAQAPLASLIRLHNREPNTLAGLAMAEAEAAADPESRSWCLAWAARHLGEAEPKRAQELLLEALSLNPTCGLALHALERLSDDRFATARSWLAASQNASGATAKADALSKAGVGFALASDFASAADAFYGASQVARDADGLRVFAARMASMAGRPSPFAEEPLPARSELDDLVAVGAASLRDAPKLALSCFERLEESLRGDPVAEAALSEARLAVGRFSEVSGALLDELKAATDPAAEALIYAKLAEIDEHFAADSSSALLSHAAIVERLPGHRATLASLAIRYAKSDRESDLADVMLQLSRVLEDDHDAVAAAATSARLGTSPLEAFRSFSQRRPTSVYAAVALEALTEDPQERSDCLRRLAEAQRPVGVHVSRFADALERGADTESALRWRNRALEIHPDSPFDLRAVALQQREAGDDAGLLVSLRRLARNTSFADERRALLLDAAHIALERLGDAAMAKSLALGLLAAEPSDEEVFSFVKSLMVDGSDLAFSDDALGARIAGCADASERRALLLEQAAIRERRGAPDGAKESLAQVVALFPEDVETRRALAVLHKSDAEWPEAIAQLFECARYVQDPAVGIDLFFELGSLYQDHGDRPDLAEKCFLKVLGWDRGHFAAMERLASLYEAMQNWPRRAQALEHLVGLAADEEQRIGKTVELAEALDRHLGRSRDAEQMLNDARRSAPLDIRPIESLAAIYTRQRDTLALNVLLDQAQVTHALAIADAPGDAPLYGNVLAIQSMKKEEDIAAMAATALAFLGAEPPPRYAAQGPEPWWDVGARLGEGTVFEFLCPKEVTPGLRETLSALEEPVSKLLGVGAKNLASSSLARLDKKHALTQLFAQTAASYGVKGDPVVYSGDFKDIRIAPGSVPAVVVPSSIAASSDEAIQRFSVAYALSLHRAGLAIGTMLPDDALKLLIAACVKLSIPGFDLRGVDSASLVREVDRLRPAVPNKLIERIHPFAFDCSAALETPDLAERIRAFGNRAGFIASGKLSAAVAALRTVAGAGTSALGEVPGMGGLMSFVFSKVHLELRQRMGI